MVSVENNNNIIVSEKPNNIINSKSMGITESGLWNIFINNETGKKTYRPTDVNYFNNHYHANKKEIICDICGKSSLNKKIAQHKKSIKCRLVHFIHKEELKLKETDKV
jgi:hypothetical protein